MGSEALNLSSEMNNLSEEILSSFKKRIKENEELVINVQKTLDRFQKGQHEMVASILTSFTKVEKGRLEESKKRLRTSVNQINKIYSDNLDLSSTISPGLDDEEKNRMKEFIVLMNNIYEEFSVIFNHSEEIKIGEKHLKLDNQIGSEKEFEYDGMLKMESKPKVQMTLNEKVLGYINQHPTGVKISEMELPLGEPRMKLGFVAKYLLEEGKVQKIDNSYYPLSQHRYKNG
jgi:soluble cytochrome b562